MIKILDGLLTGLVVINLWRYLEKRGSLSFAKGVIALVILKEVTKYMRLDLFSELVNYAVLVTLFSIPFIFQNEIQYIYRRLGGIGFRKSSEAPRNVFMYQIMKSVNRFSENKTGALIVLENEDSLRSVIETGVKVNSDLQYDILRVIFENQSALHDGAVVIAHNTILAARCILPLSDDRRLSGDYGTRHRAAKGISEKKDCIVIVVSEETGMVSIVEAGVITTYRDMEGFRSALEKISESEDVLKKGIMEPVERFLNWIDRNKKENRM